MSSRNIFLGYGQNRHFRGILTIFGGPIQVPFGDLGSLRRFGPGIRIVLSFCWLWEFEEIFIDSRQNLR